MSALWFGRKQGVSTFEPKRAHSAFFAFYVIFVRSRSAHGIGFRFIGDKIDVLQIARNLPDLRVFGERVFFRRDRDDVDRPGPEYR